MITPDYIKYYLKKDDIYINILDRYKYIFIYYYVDNTQFDRITVNLDKNLKENFNIIDIISYDNRVHFLNNGTSLIKFNDSKLNEMLNSEDLTIKKMGILILLNKYIKNE
jgi:hypothetical protein